MKTTTPTHQLIEEAISSFEEKTKIHDYSGVAWKISLREALSLIASKSGEEGRYLGLAKAYEIVGKTKQPGYPDGKFNVSMFKRIVRKTIWKALSQKEQS